MRHGKNWSSFFEENEASLESNLGVFIQTIAYLDRKVPLWKDTVKRNGLGLFPRNRWKVKEVL